MDIEDTPHDIQANDAGVDLPRSDVFMGAWARPERRWCVSGGAASRGDRVEECSRKSLGDLPQVRDEELPNPHLRRRGLETRTRVGRDSVNPAGTAYACRLILPRLRAYGDPASRVEGRGLVRRGSPHEPARPHPRLPAWSSGVAMLPASDARRSGSGPVGCSYREVKAPALHDLGTNRAPGLGRGGRNRCRSHSPCYSRRVLAQPSGPDSDDRRGRRHARSEDRMAEPGAGNPRKPPVHGGHGVSGIRADLPHLPRDPRVHPRQAHGAEQRLGRRLPPLRAGLDLAAERAYGAQVTSRALERLMVIAALPHGPAAMGSR